MKDNKKVWFITGAGRGMGVDFVKAALSAGFNVVERAEINILGRAIDR